MIQINPNLDRSALAERFRSQGWVQIRDVLTVDSALAVQEMLVGTPWGLAWQVGPDEAHYEPADKLAAMSREGRAEILARLKDAKRNAAAYSYAYSRHALEGSPHGDLLEALNGADFLRLIRAVSGDAEIARVDGQATLYAPGHYLAAHDDHEAEIGRRLAYVLSVTKGEWRPEWGGYLNFFDDEGDIRAGIRPRFNSLNLFAVPRWHSVSQVLGDAPTARYAVSGWGRGE